MPIKEHVIGGGTVIAKVMHAKCSIRTPLKITELWVFVPTGQMETHVYATREPIGEKCPRSARSVADQGLVVEKAL
jgi:hypothetical protein